MIQWKFCCECVVVDGFDVDVERISPPRGPEIGIKAPNRLNTLCEYAPCFTRPVPLRKAPVPTSPKIGETDLPFIQLETHSALMRETSFKITAKELKHG